MAQKRSLLLLSVSVITAGCQAPSVLLPSTDAALVAKIEAELETIERTTGRFTVDPADHERVLRLFDGGTVDPHPALWMVAGNVQIHYKDGRRCGIALYQTLQEMGAYSVGRTDYRGSTDEALLRTLTECWERVKPKQGP